jgi:carboxyl-terminal processing protease
MFYLASHVAFRHCEKPKRRHSPVPTRLQPKGCLASLATTFALEAKQNMSRLLGVGILLAVGMGVGFGAEVWAKPVGEAASEAAYKQVEVLARALHDIESRAVTRPSLERLVQAAIRGMLREIDSGSRYIPAEELSSWEASSEVGEVGLGFQEEAGSFVVTEVREGFAAQKAGIRKGDILLSVDGRLLQGLSAVEVRSQLMGPTGSQATLLLKRDGVLQPLRFRVKRIPLWPSPLETHWVDTVWVVRLSRFSSGVSAELSRQLPAVLHNKPAAILLDLRGNMGGLLQEALGVASLFLPPRSPIVHIQGPLATRLERTPSSADAAASVAAERVPLLLLVDQSSASVAEVLAAAFKDNGRAQLWGERSHGKGSVQERLLLPDGSAMYLTVARFVRLTGVKIDGEGVEPDCFLNQAKVCKALEGFSPKPRKLPTKHKDAWLELAVSWLEAQGAR